MKMIGEIPIEQRDPVPDAAGGAGFPPAGAPHQPPFKIRMAHKRGEGREPPIRQPGRDRAEQAIRRGSGQLRPDRRMHGQGGPVGGAPQRIEQRRFPCFAGIGSHRR